jgi:biofilm PGA synthesis N-glycosyltransferase PgaC
MIASATHRRDRGARESGNERSGVEPALLRELSSLPILSARSRFHFGYADAQGLSGRTTKWKHCFVARNSLRAVPHPLWSTRSMLKLPSYVVITPARNEGQFIELTLKCMLAQTVLPAKWVVVSDGSTDGTDDIVRKYAAEHSWIELMRMSERSERHFAGKVYAFNAGHDRVGCLQYEVIGSLDADISFGEDYFEFLLRQLAEDPALGVVGTGFREQNGSNQFYDYSMVGLDHVSGACQLFRRKCFEEIGGYVPVKSGGVDSIAVITARMKGWKTRTFTDRLFVHHRAIGTAQHSALTARFRQGAKDHALGSHPLWELFRTAYQTTQRPFGVGGLFLLSGYVWAVVKHAERPVSPELVRFRRREQMGRLKKFLWKSMVVSKRPLQTLN